MSPEISASTASGSFQLSPEPYHDRDTEIASTPPHLQLGDPLITQKPSLGSIGIGTVNGGGGAMAEVMNNSASTGHRLIRRFSNRLAKARRQSAAAANSRDVCLGPGILRRRSDSTTTPPVDTVVLTDSDEDVRDEASDTAMSTDVTLREPAWPSSAPFNYSAIGPHEPVIPLALIKGTMLEKVSKNKKRKRMLFTLESNAGKIVWKGRSLKCLYIDDIKDIRIGSDTRQSRIDFGIPDSEEGRFFTIVRALPHTSKSKPMHLIAENEETFTQWVTALESISKHRESHMASLMAFDEDAVRKFWNSEMSKRFENKPHSLEDEKIDFQGVERVCRIMHIHISQRDLRAKFAIADTTKTNQLNFVEFQVFFREMQRRNDVSRIYRQWACDSNRGITWHEFRRFLQNIQCEDVDNNIGFWEAKFIQYAQRSKPKETLGSRPSIDLLSITEVDLAAYLVSKDNDHLVREPAGLVLDRPMNEYFISSSHNTYLIGRQIADVSSVEGYIMTLLRGARSIEIDCWDGPDGQPVVKHGRALTSTISFREVINTVNKYAFVASRFPLWLSLEIRCNAATQEIMVETMKEIFGPRLVTEPLDPSADRLPCPSDLKECILIKVKGAHQKRIAAETNGRRRGNSLTSPFSKPVPADNGNIPTQHLPSSPLLGPSQQSRRGVGKRVDTITEGEVHEAASSSTSDCETEGENGGKKEGPVIKALGDLGVYCSGVKFDSWDSAICKKTNHILSFMESTFKKHAGNNVGNKAGKKALARHNMRYMMRVYPQFSRLGSGNFDPLQYWRKGVQMAALNWQTFDHGMQLNQAMFAGGPDQSGYVLKPESLRTFRILPGGLPDEALGKLERYNMTFNIDVISAQRLMRPANLPSSRTLDPYVEVEVFDTNDKREIYESTGNVPTETPGKVRRTQIVKENGFYPEFNYPGTFALTTKFPELVFVKFTIRLSPDNTVIATYTVKLVNLKQGYRTLPLWDANGDQFLFSTLFCCIRVQPATSVYIPNPDAVDSSVGKLKTISKTVFSRTGTINKTSFEKLDIDGGYGEVIP